MKCLKDVHVLTVPHIALVRKKNPLSPRHFQLAPGRKLVQIYATVKVRVI